MTASIDDVLSRARLVYEPCTPDDIDAARARLRARLARSPKTAEAPADLAAADADVEDRVAARDLRTVCETVVTRTGMQSLADFVTDTAMPEPVGARLLGCLLQLADSDESARFWWQYAAGADDAPAAFCLYLQHLASGEVGEADWWYAQSVTIQIMSAPVDGACPDCAEDAAPATSRASVPTDQTAAADPLRAHDTSLPTTLRVLRALKIRRGSDPDPVPRTVHAVMDYIPVALAYVDEDLDLPLPAPDFAQHIRDLTEAEPPPAPARRRHPLPARRVGRCAGSGHRV